MRIAKRLGWTFGRLIAALDRLLALPLIALVLVYRYTLSPFLGSSCRFQPTCSVYALDALRHHGATRGTLLAAGRLARCQPWAESMYDPVPPRTQQQPASGARHLPAAD